jgi:hypothetical protein
MSATLAAGGYDFVEIGGLGRPSDIMTRAEGLDVAIAVHGDVKDLVP